MAITRAAMDTDDSVMQTVEILKRPGQTLGFYIREGNGVDRQEGVFISRIAPGSVVENNGLLRIGDEIIAVNSVDVTSMNLDDVVILLSIPKRLVLNIRTRRTCCKNASCPSLSTMEQGEEPPPIVVLKKGRSSSATAVEMSEKCPDEVMLGDTRGYFKGSGYGGLTAYPGDRSGSGGYSHYIHPAALATYRHGDDLDMFGDPGDHKQPPKMTGREQTVTFRSPRMGRKARGYQVDYSSDTDACYTHERGLHMPPEHRYVPRGYDPNAIRAFQDEIERTHHKYEAFLNTHHKYSKAGRSISPERYNSDSEIVNYRTKPLPPREPVLAHLLDVDDRCNSLPQMDVGESSEELKHWLRKFDNLSFEIQGQESQLPQQSVAPETSLYSTTPRAPKPSSTGRESYTSEEYWSYRHGNHPHTTTTTMHKPQHPVDATLPRTTRGPRPRVTRKLSTDSLLDYRTYQLDDDLQAGQGQGRVQGQGGFGTGVPQSRSRHSVSSVSETDSKSISRMKDLQLARKPLQIRTEDFKFYQPDLDDRKARLDRPVDGILAVHIYCGHGLKSSRTVLRDLYCVVEVDSMNKARTMIRTGAINFDWDEGFEIDLESAREMSFLTYSWDPNTRHRLCFSSTVGLQAFLTNNPGANKIALKLEPKGIMYLGLEYRSPKVALQRTPSVRKGACFGVELETLLLREKTGLKVPLVLKRCIEEVDRRGLDHVGIYRLCGSARRKSQLKEEFNRNPRAVDISQDSVSDINVITGVLKDFLRELPEPLLTDALYQMLLDALSVRLPGDPDGSAKLMLSILECLPKANQETLACLLDHLKRVAVKSEVNKMNTQNLAVCFGPVLLCPAPPLGGDTESAIDFKKQIEVLRYLLDIWPEDRGVGAKNACPTTSTTTPTTTTNRGQRSPQQNTQMPTQTRLKRRSSDSSELSPYQEQLLSLNQSPYFMGDVSPRMAERLAKMASRSAKMADRSPKPRERFPWQHNKSYIDDSWSSPDSQRSHVSSGCSSSEQGSQSASQDSYSEGGVPPDFPSPVHDPGSTKSYSRQPRSTERRRTQPRESSPTGARSRSRSLQARANDSNASQMVGIMGARSRSRSRSRIDGQRTGRRLPEISQLEQRAPVHVADQRGRRPVRHRLSGDFSSLERQFSTEDSQWLAEEHKRHYKAEKDTEGLKHNARARTSRSADSHGSYVDMQRSPRVRRSKVLQRSQNDPWSEEQRTERYVANPDGYLPPEQYEAKKSHLRSDERTPQYTECQTLGRAQPPRGEHSVKRSHRRGKSLDEREFANLLFETSVRSQKLKALKKGQPSQTQGQGPEVEWVYRGEFDLCEGQYSNGEGDIDAEDAWLFPSHSQEQYGRGQRSDSRGRDRRSYEDLRPREQTSQSGHQRSSRSRSHQRSDVHGQRSKSLGREHLRRAVTFTEPPIQPPQPKSYDDSQLKTTYFYTKLSLPLSFEEIANSLGGPEVGLTHLRGHPMTRSQDGGHSHHRGQEGGHSHRHPHEGGQPHREGIHTPHGGSPRKDKLTASHHGQEDQPGASLERGRTSPC